MGARTEDRIEGGCRCGGLRFRAALPMMTAACHCRGCQLMSGSAFSLTAMVAAESFEVTRGVPILGGLKGATRHNFCPDCLSWVFTRPERVDFVVNVRASLLNDPGWCAPFVETCTEERLPWATTPARHSYRGFPQEEEFNRLLAEYAADGPRP